MLTGKLSTTADRHLNFDDTSQYLRGYSVAQFQAEQLFTHSAEAPLRVHRSVSVYTGQSLQVCQPSRHLNKSSKYRVIEHVESKNESRCTVHKEEY